MAFKENYYKISHLILFLFGLCLTGISIFLLSRNVDTVSQAFTLTAIYYTASSIFGLLAHRWERCYWYKYQALNLVIMVTSQLIIVASLAFIWDDVIYYLDLVDGSDRDEVTRTLAFLQESRVAWIVLMTLASGAYSFTAWCSYAFHQAVYKSWITSEYKRLHGLGAGSEKNHENLDEYAALHRGNNQIAIVTDDAAAPLIVDVN